MLCQPYSGHLPKMFVLCTLLSPTYGDLTIGCTINWPCTTYTDWECCIKYRLTVVAEVSDAENNLFQSDLDRSYKIKYHLNWHKSGTSKKKKKKNAYCIILHLNIDYIRCMYFTVFHQFIKSGLIISIWKMLTAYLLSTYIHTYIHYEEKGFWQNSKAKASIDHISDSDSALVQLTP